MALAVLGGYSSFGAGELDGRTFLCNIFTSVKAFSMLSLRLGRDCFSCLFILSISSFTTKTKSSTYACPQNYPFHCSSFEGPTLTFLVVETAQKKSGPHANLDLHLLTSPTQQFDTGLFVSTLPPALHLTCIHIPTSLISMMQDPTSDLPAGLVSLFLNSMSSRTTFRIAALTARPLPALLLPQKSHWFTFAHLSCSRRGVRKALGPEPKK